MLWPQTEPAPRRPPPPKHTHKLPHAVLWHPLIIENAAEEKRSMMVAALAKNNGIIILSQNKNIFKNKHEIWGPKLIEKEFVEYPKDSQFPER